MKLKLLCLLSIVILNQLIVPTCFADEVVKVIITPENVGVFTAVGEQQFTATCVWSSGNRTDCTKEVDWYVEENSFPDQLPANETVLIDQNGFAVVLNSWGRVKISACYPKGCYLPPPIQYNCITAAHNFLILEGTTEEKIKNMSNQCRDLLFGEYTNLTFLQLLLDEK